MKGMIDETELARLEALAVKATPCPWFEMNHGAFPMVYGPNCERVCRAVDNAEDSVYIAAACNNVPALIAEVRRLRAENISLREDVYALNEAWDYEYEANQRHEHMVAELMEKVEAWEWWEEVRLYDPWSEHPYCTACGNRSKRGKIFDAAVDEYEKIKSTAREAVHADRE